MFQPWEYVETYDLTPFAFARAPDRFHIDPRHLQILFAIAAEVRPRAAIEIGSYRGYSSAAFIAMLNAGFIEEAHFIEPMPTNELIAVLNHARIPKRVHLHAVPSDLAPIIDGDLVLIDGDHAEPAVRDIERAFARKPAVIAVHDTNPDGQHLASVGTHRNYGSIEAGARLRLHPDYTTFEDRKARPGEYTERGFAIGLRPDRIEPDVIELARDLIATDRVWWKEAG